MSNLIRLAAVNTIYSYDGMRVSGEDLFHFGVAFPQLHSDHFELL